MDESYNEKIMMTSLIIACISLILLRMFLVAGVEVAGIITFFIFAVSVISFIVCLLIHIWRG